MTRQTPPTKKSHHWKFRLSIALIMLVLGFISLIVLKLHARTYWLFCIGMSIVDALLSIGMVMTLRKKQSYRSGVWRQVWHWLGLLAQMYLLALLVDRGTVSQTEAGLFALSLLSLTIYLAGLYTDGVFILVGITLGLMAAGIILINGYLFFVMPPVFCLSAICIILLVQHQRKKI